MNLVKKLRKADSSKKTKLWRDANLTNWEAEELVQQMILSLPGAYKLHDRSYGTNLVDAIYDNYGWMPSMFVSERMLLGLQVMHPEKIYASFTLGLDVVEVKP